MSNFFFKKAIQFENFDSFFIWIELKAENIIALSIHFENFSILYHFYLKINNLMFLSEGENLVEND